MAQDTSRLYRGAPTTKPAESKNVSSIPAKFERVLDREPQERKGFGSEGSRFAYNDTVNPGPGTYGTQRTSLSSKTESVGRKGYGPMASSAKGRMTRRTNYTGPGPGMYNPRSTSDLAVVQSKGNTAAFASQNVSRKLPEPELPGPGAYTVEETRTGAKVDWTTTPHSYSSTFKAVPRKPPGNAAAREPGQDPGTYTMVDTWSPPPGHQGAAGVGSSVVYSRAGTSAFAGASASISMATDPASSLLYFEHPRVRLQRDGGPGPGQYEMQYFESIRTTLEKSAGKTSAPFQQHQNIGRFGESIMPPPVEPPGLAIPSGKSKHLNGGYMSGCNPQALSPPRHPPGSPLAGRRSPNAFARPPSPPKGVGAPFVSQTPAHGEYDLQVANRAPGPAYYDQAMPADRKSFHLNARQRMMP